MEWDEYKILCDRPNVLSRWFIEHTAEICGGELAEVVLSALQATPLAKPVDHKGQRELDMFIDPFDLDTVNRIVEVVDDAIARHIKSEAATPSEFRAIDRNWHEYQNYLLRA